MDNKIRMNRTMTMKGMWNDMKSACSIPPLSSVPVECDLGTWLRFPHYGRCSRPAAGGAVSAAWNGSASDSLLSRLFMPYNAEPSATLIRRPFDLRRGSNDDVNVISSSDFLSCFAWLSDSLESDGLRILGGLGVWGAECQHRIQTLTHALPLSAGYEILIRGLLSASCKRTTAAAAVLFLVSFFSR